MTELPEPVDIRDYNYVLPPERIAQHPLAGRDESRLLTVRGGIIGEDLFLNIGRHLSSGTLMVFNDTKVIRARMIFSKSTGATIEVFCLEPISPPALLQAFQQGSPVSWKCLIGNVKRWKEDSLVKTYREGKTGITLAARKKEDLGDGCFAVEFQWTPVDFSFSQVLQAMGLVPLPPYIQRPAEESDRERYQTIYAREEGSVAAPTAGLHFTGQILDNLRSRGIRFETVTLHVGIGTFRPVASPDVSRHIMHGERISVPLQVIRNLGDAPDRPRIAVGTTSVRTMETLYWLGVKILTGSKEPRPEIRQWDPYDPAMVQDIPAGDSLHALADYLEKNQMTGYSGNTELMIVPGYRFRMVRGMITNFHLPQSTLLLLVAAFIGPRWKEAYEYALQHNFRFLSYGDACLFFPCKEEG